MTSLVVARRQRAPRRRRTPGRFWRAAFFALALAGLVAVVAWALLGSRLLVVRSVVVTGTRLVPRSEVLAVAGVQPGTPLIRVNAGQVEARVETIRQVQSAQVTRDWPDRVVIVVPSARPRWRSRPRAAASTWWTRRRDRAVGRAAGRRLPLYPAPGTAVTGAARRPGPGAPRRPCSGTAVQLRHTVGSVTGAEPGSGDAAALRRDHGRVGRCQRAARQSTGAHRSHADSRAFLRRERAGNPDHQLMALMLQDPLIRDTLTGLPG